MTEPSKSEKSSLSGNVMLLLLAVLLLVMNIYYWGRVIRKNASAGDIHSPQQSQTDVSGPEVTVEPSPEPTPTPVPDKYEGLVVSEAMPENKLTLVLSNGQSPDWFELYNGSDHAVNLTDCSVSDKEESFGCTLPDITIASGEYLVIYADGLNTVNSDGIHCSFSLSDNETVYLRRPDGSLISSLDIPECGSDESVSLVFDAAGNNTVVVNGFVSPGYENSGKGYTSFISCFEAPTGLYISEVRADGSEKLETYDFIEFYNASDEPVKLSDYYITDKASELQLSQLPEVTLKSGGRYVINLGSSTRAYTPVFSLSIDGEHLYLSDGENIIDTVYYHDIPTGCTYGRIPGENGFFYFSSATPEKDNGTGYRYVSASPVSGRADGAYNGVDSVEVVLHAPGIIHYTLDCSEPTENSPVYTEPIVLDKTTVIKCLSIEDGALPSDTTVLTYFINEEHTLPLVSLVGSDPEKLVSMYEHGNTIVELAASFTMYDGDERVDANCGVTITGRGSLNLDHKSFKLHFRSCYGDSKLNYDLYGNGIDDYNSIVLKKGQDAEKLVFRNDIWEDICREFSDVLPVQQGRFCILYVNGEYYGIISVRESINDDFFEHYTGVKDDDIMRVDFPPLTYPQFDTEVIHFCALNENISDEKLTELEEYFDIDAFIDWFIMEGVSGNSDINRNVKFFRSSEANDKWTPVLFDLDRAFDAPFVHVFTETEFASLQLKYIVKALFGNESFCERFLTRFSEIYNGPLSNEHIADIINSYKELLEPEIERDRERWGYSTSEWYSYIDEFTELLVEEDWKNECLDALYKYSDISPELLDKYFPAED